MEGPTFHPCAVVGKGATTVLLIYAHLTVGSVQSEAVGPYDLEHESEVGAVFHSLLSTGDTVLPATVHQGPTGATAWCSNSGVRLRYDYVAISRKYLPIVAASGVDRRIQLDMDSHVDHLLTHGTIHAPTV